MSTPMDWQPSKAIQTKTGACEKNLFPGGLKTRKGNPGKNGMIEKKKKKTNKSKHAKSIDHRCDIQGALDSRASSNSSTIKRSYSLQVYEQDMASCLQQWSWCVFKQRHPLEEELLQVYVRTRAITCPIFQCFVCLCEIMSVNCQSSCISRHSYMHNHASYMSMHLIKLLCSSYTFAFSIPMLISPKINHVNFKFNQSCQFQNPAVLSNFKI